MPPDELWAKVLRLWHAYTRMPNAETWWAYLEAHQQYKLKGDKDNE